MIKTTCIILGILIRIPLQNAFAHLPAKNIGWFQVSTNVKRTSTVLISDKRLAHPRDRDYFLALGAVGFSPIILDLGSFTTLDLKEVLSLIIPGEIAKELSPTAVEAIVKQVQSGMFVYTEEVSPLSVALGIRYLGTDIQVNSIRDQHHPDIAIDWADTLAIHELNSGGLNIYSYAKINYSPILAGGTLGQGRWLYSAVQLDSVNGWGYGRLPYFHEAFLEQFGIQPLLYRQKLIAYLDWPTIATQDYQELAQQMKSKGISEIHLSSFYSVAGRHDLFEAFINACHSQGILVYSWLELPMVNPEFWTLHPECREKTATGRDAQVDWRFLMALEIPKCMDEVQAELKLLLETLPWDGVDVAELYFDSPSGFDSPANFTPMSQWVRDTFKAQSGVDPIDYLNRDSLHYYRKDESGFAQFLNFRSKLCVRLNREIVNFVKSLRIQPFNQPPPVMLSLVDSVIDKTMGNLIGINTADFIGLQKEMGFDLQIEDPFTLWQNGPDRYQVIGASYRNLVNSEARLTVDINIVKRGNDSQPQTGLEFLELLYQAGRFFDQVCIYAANTPFSFDYKYAGAALAGNASIKLISSELDAETFEIKSPYTVLFKTETLYRSFLVNGVAWPCFNNEGIWIPEGDSTLEVRTKVQPSTVHLTSASGEIRECAFLPEGIRLRYSEKKSMLVTLSHAIAATKIDGQVAVLPKFNNGETETIYLPAGAHEAVFEVLH
jgi:hypothetical protein